MEILFFQLGNELLFIVLLPFEISQKTKGKIFVKFGHIGDEAHDISRFLVFFEGLFEQKVFTFNKIEVIAEEGSGIIVDL
jgi:hypothetical protein